MKCFGCGKEINENNSVQLVNYEQSYCSWECLLNASKKTATRSVCNCCGKETNENNSVSISFNFDESNEQPYCSLKCFQTFLNKKGAGKKNTRRDK